MTADQVDKIIVGIFDLLKVILGSTLTWLITKKAAKTQEVKALRRDLTARIVAILTEDVVNQLPLRLKELKAFIVEHHELLEVKENVDFCSKWLTEPFLDVPAAGLWTTERKNELARDLGNLRTP